MSTRTLVTANETRDQPNDATIAEAFQACSTAGFWLDITSPDDSDFGLLEHALGFHPLTIEDIRQQNQRPKFEDYESYSFVVLFGALDAQDDMTFVEHHLYVAPHYCVSVRRQPAPIIDQLLERVRKNGPREVRNDAPTYGYLVMDQIVDGMFSILDTLDVKVSHVLDTVIEGQSRVAFAAIPTYMHQVSDLRRVLGAHQDLFMRLVSHVVSRGDRDVVLYYRDVYDHVIRQYDMVDSLRDLLSNAMDVSLASVSNQLGVTVRTLTVISSLFLPLTFLTGFFGMNFAALINSITSPWAIAVGVGLMALSVIVQLALFRRRGWI